MKKQIFLFFLLIFLGISCSSVDVVINKHHAPGKMERIAVFPVRGLGRTNGRKLADLLMIELLRQGYDVIERDQLRKVMKELRFGMSGYVDQRKAVEVGRMVGADTIVVGSGKINRRDNTLNYLVLKFINVKTSHLSIMANIQEEMPIESAAEDIPYAIRNKMDEFLNKKR